MTRREIAAIVHNANKLLALEQAGGFKKHLRSFPDYDALAKDLKKRFKFFGDSGVYHFLWTVRHPVPDWHDWSKAHGMDWGAKAKAGRVAVRPPDPDDTRAREPKRLRRCHIAPARFATAITWLVLRAVTALLRVIAFVLPPAIALLGGVLRLGIVWAHGRHRRDLRGACRPVPRALARVG